MTVKNLELLLIILLYDHLIMQFVFVAAIRFYEHQMEPGMKQRCYYKNSVVEID